MHLRLLERFQTCRVSVGDGPEASRTAYLYVYKPAVCRNRITVLIHEAYVDIAEVFSVSFQHVPVRRQPYCRSLSSRAYCLFLDSLSALVICHDADFSRLICHFVPHQAEALHCVFSETWHLAVRFGKCTDSLRFAVDEKLRRRI